MPCERHRSATFRPASPSLTIARICSSVYVLRFIGPPLNRGPHSMRRIGLKGAGQGDSLTSPSGRYWLVYQGDGNLVLYDLATAVALWWTGTVGEIPGQAVMQGDGNFVVYNADGSPVWWSATEGDTDGRLFVQD